MKQQNFLYFFFVLLAFSFHTAIAQNVVFKPGDRVLVSPLSLKDEKYWRAGTVTEVHNYTPKKAYSVACDPQGGSGSATTFVVNEDWIKALPAGQNTSPKVTTPKQENSTALPKQNNTVTCPPSDPDSKGRTALEKSIRGAIREGWERQPELGADGKVTVTFQDVNVGTSHAWRELQDPIDARGKTIYEVRSDFTTCTDYNRRIVLVKRERAFACYNKGSGKWSCEVVAAANTNVKDQSQSIDKPIK